MCGLWAIDIQAPTVWLRRDASLHYLIPDKTTKSDALGNNIASLDGCGQDAFESSIY